MSNPGYAVDAFTAATVDENIIKSIEEVKKFNLESIVRIIIEIKGW
jgi:hypothetical protein